MNRRSVAQPGSAHAWGACGRWFKSSRSDHLPDSILKRFFSTSIFKDGYLKMDFFSLKNNLSFSIFKSNSNHFNDKN